MLVMIIIMIVIVIIAGGGQLRQSMWFLNVRDVESYYLYKLTYSTVTQTATNMRPVFRI